MFGKISSLISYWKVLEVYIYRRFPFNKLPLWGCTFSYVTLYLLWKHFSVCSTAQMYRMRRLSEESRGMQQWNFNNAGKGERGCPLMRPMKCPLACKNC